MVTPKLDLTYIALIHQTRNILFSDNLYMGTGGKINNTCIPKLVYQYIPSRNRNQCQTRKNRQNKLGTAYIPVLTIIIK
jgi:hypothetical protein